MERSRTIEHEICRIHVRQDVILLISQMEYHAVCRQAPRISIVK